MEGSSGNSAASSGQGNNPGGAPSAGGDNGLGNQAVSATQTTDVATNENVSDQEQKPDHRKLFRSRFKKEGDDFDVDNDETFYPKAMEHIDTLEKYKTDNTAINKKMIDTLKANPEAAGFMRDLMKGASLQEALARNIDMDSIKPMEGDPDYDSWKSNLENRQKTLAEKEAYIKEIETNTQMTTAELRAFRDENQLTDDEAMQFIDSVDEMIANAVKGKIDKKTLTKLYRAMNADKEIEAAVEKTKVDVRNEKIEAVKEKDLNPKVGDGLPRLDGTNVDKETTKQKTDPWASAVDEDNKRRNIYK